MPVVKQNREMQAASQDLRDEVTHADRDKHMKLFVKLCAKGGAFDLENFLDKGYFEVDERLSINSRPENWTGLFYACRALNIETIEVLLRRGANPNEISQGDFSPLMAITIASDEKDHTTALTCAKLLVDGGASVSEVPSYIGRTLLTRAVLTKNIPLVEFFLEAGAGPNERDGRGEAPLNIAVSMNETAIAYTLIDFYANPYIKNLNGECSMSLSKGSKEKMLGVGQYVHNWRINFMKKNFGKDIQKFRKMVNDINIPCLQLQTNYVLEPVSSDDEGDLTSSGTKTEYYNEKWNKSSTSCSTNGTALPSKLEDAKMVESIQHKSATVLQSTSEDEGGQTTTSELINVNRTVQGKELGKEFVLDPEGSYKSTDKLSKPSIEALTKLAEWKTKKQTMRKKSKQKGIRNGTLSPFRISFSRSTEEDEKPTVNTDDTVPKTDVDPRKRKPRTKSWMSIESAVIVVGVLTILAHRLKK